MDGDAWWDNEVKDAIDRKKKTWSDYVSCLQTNIGRKMTTI